MSSREAPRLLSRRLLIALPSEADASEMLAYETRNQEHLKPWSPPQAEGAPNLRATLDRIHSNTREFSAGRSARLWLRLREQASGAFVGATSLSNIVLGAFRACHLGYHLDAEQQGKGLMTEALQSVLAYAFDELQLHRVMASYMPSNQRSAHLLERLGFEREGYAKDYLYIDDGYKDHVLTALTNQRLRNARELCIGPPVTPTPSKQDS